MIKNYVNMENCKYASDVRLLGASEDAMNGKVTWYFITRQSSNIMWWDKLILQGLLNGSDSYQEKTILWKGSCAWDEAARCVKWTISLVISRLSGAGAGGDVTQHCISSQTRSHIHKILTQSTHFRHYLLHLWSTLIHANMDRKTPSEYDFL